MQLSNRILSMEESPIRKLYPMVNRIKKEGKRVYHLNIGQPDIKTPPTFFQAIQEYKEEVLSYCDSAGMPALIHSIQGYYKMYNMHFDEDEILVTNGGSEALLFAFIALCDNGDQIIVPEPFYSNYNSFAEVAGAEILPIPTRVEDDFALPSMEEMEKLISPRVKAFLITHPSNPTGKIYSPEEMERVIALAKKYDLFIITDEVYREFVYDGLDYLSFGNREDIEDRVILIDSISKRFSACGARIGAIISKNKELMQNVLKLCQSRLAVSTINQIGAVQLFKTPKEYFQEVIQEYQNRRDTLYKALSKIEGVHCAKPKGAFYLIAKLPVDDSERFVRWMIEHFDIDGETLLLAPAQGFYTTEGKGKDEVRIAYVLREEALLKAMHILEEGLKVYPGRK